MMTEDEIRRLLGGYAANSLSAEERKRLFDAALEDQKLFDALQQEDTLRELLEDPVVRSQARQALEAARRHRQAFAWRRWAVGVAVPAVAAVVVIAVMNRPNPPVVSKPYAFTAQKSAEPAVVGPPPIPEEVRRQFSPQIAVAGQLYQGPLVQYAPVRQGPGGETVRFDVTTGITGYLALYQVDPSGNAKHVYPESELAAPVAAGGTIQLSSLPIKAADSGEKLRLVVVPAALPQARGVLGGAKGHLVTGATLRVRPARKPLVVDLSLASH
jgi:hypothetical protein